MEIERKQVGFTKLGSGVLIVGDAPDHPAAKAGVLQRAMTRSGLVPEDFGYADIQMPAPNSDPLGGAVERFRPKGLLALGNTCLKTLAGISDPGRTVSMLRGYVLDSCRYPDVLVVPTYCPRDLLRGGKRRNQETGAKVDSGAGKGGMHLFGVLCFDLLKAVQIARDGYRFDPPRYQEHPSIDEAEAFLNTVRDNSRSPIRGPALVGTAATDKVAKEVGDCIHFEAYAEEVETVDRVTNAKIKRTNTRVRAFFVSHPDPRIPNVLYKCKPRVPAAMMPELLAKWPGGYFEPTIHSGLDDFLRVEDELLARSTDDERKWKAEVDAKLARESHKQ